jgi:hypothetical protein
MNEHDTSHSYGEAVGVTHSRVRCHGHHDDNRGDTSPVRDDDSVTDPVCEERVQKVRSCQ